MQVKRHVMQPYMQRDAEGILRKTKFKGNTTSAVAKHAESRSSSGTKHSKTRKPQKDQSKLQVEDCVSPLEVDHEETTESGQDIAAAVGGDQQDLISNLPPFLNPSPLPNEIDIDHLTFWSYQHPVQPYDPFQQPRVLDVGPSTPGSQMDLSSTSMPCTPAQHILSKGPGAIITDCQRDVTLFPVDPVLSVCNQHSLSFCSNEMREYPCQNDCLYTNTIESE